MLINCAECAKKISSQAEVCPQCGWKHQEFIIDGKLNPNWKLPELDPNQYSSPSHSPSQSRTRKQSAFWNPILSIVFLIFLFWCIYVCVILPFEWSSFAIPRNTTVESTEIKAQDMIDDAVIPNLPAAPAAE